LHVRFYLLVREGETSLRADVSAFVTACQPHLVRAACGLNAEFGSGELALWELRTQLLQRVTEGYSLAMLKVLNARMFGLGYPPRYRPLHPIHLIKLYGECERFYLEEAARLLCALPTQPYFSGNS
jgi:hypothetical protein